MSDFFLKVSIGEAIDKYSILEIKNKRIFSVEKLKEIRKELNELSSCLEFINKNKNLYDVLIYINEKIWDMTDEIKAMRYTDEKFSYIANEIFEFNQKRFRIKKKFNYLSNSIINEQKSYNEDICKIEIDSINSFFSKKAEINYLTVEYDYLLFDKKFENEIEKNTSYLFSEMKYKDLIKIDDFSIPDNLKTIFNY